MRIAIIGAGAIGNALAGILKEKRGNSVALWDAIPEKVKGQKPLDKLLSRADAVFFCLPSFALRDAAETVRPHLKRRTAVICVSKGIEAGTDLTVDKLLRKILPRRQPFALLFGPMLAGELARGACGHAVTAGAARAVSLCIEMFRGTRFSVIKSADLVGVALCGALKNVYAIGLGIIAALKAGDNVIGAYIVEARSEMKSIIGLRGGRPETADGYAGLGDLVATGLNANSRNRQIGCALVSSPGRCQGSEGARATVALAELLGKRRFRFPIFSAVHDILALGAAPSDLIAAVCRWR